MWKIAVYFSAHTLSAIVLPRFGCSGDGTEKKQGKPNLSEQKLAQLCIKNETLQNTINELINEAVEKKTKVFIEEIKILKKEVKDIETSQDFTSSKHDNLKKEYDSQLNTNQKQKEDLKCANEKLAKLEKNFHRGSSKHRKFGAIR